MTLTDFLQAVNAAGLQFAVKAGKLQMQGPAGAITPNLRVAAARYKESMIAMLAAQNCNGAVSALSVRRSVAQRKDDVITVDGEQAGQIACAGLEVDAQRVERNGEADPPDGAGTVFHLGLGCGSSQSVNGTATVVISGKRYSYSRRWAGERLASADGIVAFDTETDLVPLDREIPRLALASCSAGDTASCLIHPDDVGAFIVAHQDLQYVCHHSAFDFWAVDQHLRKRGEEEACRTWWDLAATNRLHDSMLLEMLVRLARDDSYPDPRDLATVAKQYARLELSKDDPFRMRYAEIIGVDWDTVEDGFFDYAIKDAIVSRVTYLAIRKHALALVEEFGRQSGDILPEARERFGLLTEGIQVKKAIALAQITRNGMWIDQEWIRRAEADLRQRLDEAVAQVQALCPALYKTS
jgi:hypothetical protein